MGVKVSITYTGDSQTELQHEASGATIKTDLPVDNGGKGRMFSPTDLFASSLGACMLTIMSAMAERHNVDITGTYAELEKHMTDAPRRVAKIEGKIFFAASVPEEKKKLLMGALHACPVHKSLHPDIEVDIVQA